MRAEPPADQAPPDGGKLLIITGRPGRMANRLVLFAHIIGFAEEHRYRVVNPTFHSYADLFENTRSDVFCQYPAASRKSLLDSLPGVSGIIKSTRMFYHAGRLARTLQEKFGFFGRSVAVLEEMPRGKLTLLDGPEVRSQIDPAKVVLVNGWKLRAPEYVQKHADKIRKHFQPAVQIEQDVHLLMQRVRQNADVVIGVHIRQGDYRRWKGGKYFFPTSRYAAWMRELMSQFPGAKVSFLVCSDEPRTDQEFQGLPVVLSVNTPVGDLCALSKCDYLFGPVSTYSLWASFYGNVPLFHVGNSDDRMDRAQFRVSWLDDR